MTKGKTWEQYKPECEAVAKPGITILGWVGEWSGNCTKLKLYCQTHKVSWETTSIQGLKKTGSGCPVCANLIRAQAAKVARQGVAPGSAKKWEQHKAECEAISPPHIKVLGYVGDWRWSNTKLHLVCDTHGEWDTTSISNFKKAASCPKCGVAKRTTKLRKTWEQHKAECQAVAKPGITVLRYIGEWKGIYTRIVCRCEKHGEWDTSNINKFKYGRSCPKCKAEITTKRNIDNISKPEDLIPMCEERCGEGVSIVGYCKPWRGVLTPLKINCEKHGVLRVRNISQFLRRGDTSGCPRCAGNDQQTCYINVVYDNQTPICLKFGIAKCYRTRLASQNSRNLFQMEHAQLYSFPSVVDCRSAETACKIELATGILNRKELSDGWTETVALTDYDKVVSIYERFGGVRVDTLTKEEK